MALQLWGLWKRRPLSRRVLAVVIAVSVSCCWSSGRAVFSAEASVSEGRSHSGEKTELSHIRLLEKMAGAADAGGEATTDDATWLRSTSPATAVGGVEERLMRMVYAARQTHKQNSDSGQSSPADVTLERSEPRLAYVSRKRRPDGKSSLLQKRAALTAAPALLFTHLIMGKRMQDDILHGSLSRVPSFFEKTPDMAGFNKLTAGFMPDDVDSRPIKVPTSLSYGIGFKALPPSPGIKAESPSKVSSSLWNPFDSLQVDGFEPAKSSTEEDQTNGGNSWTQNTSPQTPAYSRETSLVGELPSLSLPWPAGRLDGKVKAREFEDVWGGARNAGEMKPTHLYASAPDVLGVDATNSDFVPAQSPRPGKKHPLLSAAFSNEAMAISGAALLGLAGAGAYRLAKNLRSGGRGSGEIVSPYTSVWELDECILVLDVFGAERAGTLKGSFVPHSLKATVNLRQQRIQLSYLTSPSFRSDPVRFLLRRKLLQTESIDIPRDECLASPGQISESSYETPQQKKQRRKEISSAAALAAKAAHRGKKRGKKAKDKAEAALKEHRRKAFVWTGPVYREYVEISEDAQRTVALSFKFKRNGGWLPIIRSFHASSLNPSASPEEEKTKSEKEEGARRRRRRRALENIAIPSRNFARSVLSALEAVAIGLTTEGLSPVAPQPAVSFFSEESSSSRPDNAFVEVVRKEGFCQWNVALKKLPLGGVPDVQVYLDLGTQQFKVAATSNKKTSSRITISSLGTQELLNIASPTDFTSESIIDIPDDCYVALVEDVSFQVFAFIQEETDPELRLWNPDSASETSLQENPWSLREEVLIVAIKASVFQNTEVDVRDEAEEERETTAVRQRSSKAKKNASTEVPTKVLQLPTAMNSENSISPPPSPLALGSAEASTDTQSSP